MYLFSWFIVPFSSLSFSHSCQKTRLALVPYSHAGMLLLHRWFCLCVGCSEVYVKWVIDLSASSEAVITSQLTLRCINNIAESCRNWVSEQKGWVSLQFSPEWHNQCAGTVLLSFLFFSAKQRNSAVGVSSLVPCSPERAVNTYMMKYNLPWSVGGIMQYCQQ